MNQYSRAVRAVNSGVIFELPENLSDIQRIKVLGLFETWFIRSAYTRDVDDFLWEVGQR